MKQITLAMMTALIVITSSNVARGSIIEIGDLNIINSPENPSNGLRFLDMSYGGGLTLEDALLNARATYPNTRLATPSEWDDLFVAAGIVYSGALRASDAFTAGGAEIEFIASGNFGGAALIAKLGPTSEIFTNRWWVWSSPDGDSSPTSTRDFLYMTGTDLMLWQTESLPASTLYGWMLVSDETVATPEPSTFVGLGLGVAALCIRGRRRLTQRSKVVAGGPAAGRPLETTAE
jgi:hypothetical protein